MFLRRLSLADLLLILMCLASQTRAFSSLATKFQMNSGRVMSIRINPHHRSANHPIATPRWPTYLYSSSSSSKTITINDPENTSRSKTICSSEPLVYTVSQLLTPEECGAVQDYVTQLERQQERTMTQSNPPLVSLDATKLWPLLPLALLAGVPPVLRQMMETNNAGGSLNTLISVEQILSLALPNIILALLASAVLAYGVILPVLRRQANSTSRTSVALALNQEQDLALIRPLVDRICQTTGHAWFQWEAPVVTRYDPGAIFARHGDASPTRGSEWAGNGGQRLITCICYLNTLTNDNNNNNGNGSSNNNNNDSDNAGGETYFDQLNLAIVPEQGKALVFFPADPETWVADDRTTHESLPPKTQEKWILQLFGRAQRVPPPLGLPDSYDDSTTNCSDDDDDRQDGSVA